MKRQISFHISTVFRPNGYVHRTIESLEQTSFFDDPERLPLNLFVNSDESDYLNRYEQQPDRFRVHRLPQELAHAIKEFTGMQRAALNYARCLSVDDARFISIFEDDIRFSKGWLERLNEAINEVESAHGTDWVMSLYSPLTDESAVRAREGKRWFARTWEGFFGTQGVVYPTLIAKAFVDEILRVCVDPFEKAYDIALADFLKERRIPLVATAPCLIQHMGDVSQGVCDRFHQSLGFMEEVPN